MLNNADKDNLALSNREPKEDVRERLLDAAESLFGRQGFDRTSIRDLTTEAGCNVAAVNYHFGGKEQLYTEMFRRQMSMVMGDCVASIDDVMASPEPSVESLIRAWITPPLKAVAEQAPRAMMVRLLIREFLDQRIDMEHVACDIKEFFINHVSVALRGLVPGLDEPRSMLAVFSIEALFFHPMLFMDYYLQLSPAQDVDKVIDHIVTFGAEAIRKYGEV
ncbi:TetR/AcrR family transcriptional regulator [Planctomycetota bacterium]